MKRNGRDPKFNGFGSMQSALLDAGMLTTKKGGMRKNMSKKCACGCGRFVEFLSSGADLGLRDGCYQKIKDFKSITRLYGERAVA
jgi:hypothetical protein